jgi:hypothetical protein
VKATDDYRAKLRMWAQHPRVVALPAAPPLPKFPPQKFRSHAEMNKWKLDLLRRMARESLSHG